MMKRQTVNEDLNCIQEPSYLHIVLIIMATLHMCKMSKFHNTVAYRPIAR